ncbi:hypothetical protein BD770DRAFT_403204 [Pilaira anomala]|nr:hypothetical protein BD770DRAFT_403204 [Pilaira anomala]
MSSTNDLILQYREQNKEIIKQNMRLTERISVLEGVINELQNDNLKFRIEKAKAVRKKPTANNKIKKTTPPKINNDPEKKEKKKDKKKSIDLDNTEQIIDTKRHKKPVSYVLPNTKSKLRKGDPFTFGNEA